VIGEIDWTDVKTKGPDSLEQLYPTGTPMKEVHPEFRGMSLPLWQKLKMHERVEKYLKTSKPETPAAISDWPGRERRMKAKSA